MNSCSLIAHSVCLKCSEMSLLKIRTDLSILIPPVEPSVSGAEMDPGENPHPSHPWACSPLQLHVLLLSQALCLGGRRPPPHSCTVSLCLCVLAQVALLASTSFVLSDWLLFDVLHIWTWGPRFLAVPPSSLIGASGSRAPHVCHR